MPFGEILLLSTMAVSAAVGTIFSLCNLDVVFGTTARKRAGVVRLKAQADNAAKAA